MHMLELETVRVSKSPTTVVTPKGEVQTKEESTVYARELTLFVTVMLLEHTLAVLSLGKLCEDHGYTYRWTSVKNHNSSKMVECNSANYVPIVVLGKSTDSSSSVTPTSPTSVPQEAVVPTLHPASTRSDKSTRRTVRGDPSHEPAETKNTNTNEDNETVGENHCMNCQNG